MKTISKCFLNIALCSVLGFFEILCVVIDIKEHCWIDATVSVTVFALCVWTICSAYNRAKRIEESREARIRMIYDVLPIDEIIVCRIMSEIFKDIKPKDTNDELEKPKSTPEGADK